MEQFQLPVRVYIEDTDAGGIVYYVNYLKFMERARTEFMRKLGFDKPALLDGAMLVVHSANVRYLQPARLDDALLVSADVLRLARSYLVFSQCVIRAGEPICEGEIKVACVERTTMKPMAMPPAVYRAIKSTLKN